MSPSIRSVRTLAALALVAAPLVHAQRGPAEVLRVRSLAPSDPIAIELDYRAAELRVQFGTRSEAPDGAVRPTIMLTGYWPPTNEMVRPFSTDPIANPDGWVGGNWEGRGYDVVSFFPEFDPPDCEFCGKGEGLLEVDYQDTSNDFWPLAETVQPVALVTFSRGFNDMSWEVEMNQFNRTSWISDYLFPFQPNPAPPDEGAPAEQLRLSALPVRDIVTAVDDAALGLDPYICFTQDGGSFLSEFIAYHGVWYQGLHASPADPTPTVAAGHVHVGQQIPWETARRATEVTLRTVIEYVDSILDVEACQRDRGFGGPGLATLTVCGDALRTGGTAELFLRNGPPNAEAWLIRGSSLDPVGFAGGTIGPARDEVRRLTTNFQGQLLLPGFTGGGGPSQEFVQIVYEDPSAAEGWGFSNVVELDILP